MVCQIQTRLGQYHHKFWKEYVFNAGKQFGVNIKPRPILQS